MNSMAQITRKYSKGQIDRAGRDLISLPIGDPGRNVAIEIIDNWRSCHAYPLQIVKMTLSNRAKRIEPKALIAQRLKRRPSIEIKLLDNPQMQLSQMQDLGGCRAVLSTMRSVRRLVYKYKIYDAIHRRVGRSYIDRSDDYDYIAHPKNDGYRGIHFIVRYQTPSEDLAAFNGQRIEIQIRTRLQHAWATAVETAQLFTGQALKSKVKRATDEWLRFFVLASGAFAVREKSPPVPGVPIDRQELLTELNDITNTLNILSILPGWSETLRITEKAKRAEYRDASTFVLSLNTKEYSLGIYPFSKNQLEDAQEKYDVLEKESELKEWINVVLVTVEDMKALRTAYPNYYVDTNAFVGAVIRELSSISK